MNYAEDFINNGSFTLEEKSESIFMTLLPLVTPFAMLVIFVLLFWFQTIGVELLIVVMQVVKQ